MIGTIIGVFLVIVILVTGVYYYSQYKEQQPYQPIESATQGSSTAVTQQPQATTNTSLDTTINYTQPTPKPLDTYVAIQPQTVQSTTTNSSPQVTTNMTSTTTQISTTTPITNIQSEYPSIDANTIEYTPQTLETRPELVQTIVRDTYDVTPYKQGKIKGMRDFNLRCQEPSDYISEILLQGDGFYIYSTGFKCKSDDSSYQVIKNPPWPVNIQSLKSDRGFAGLNMYVGDYVNGIDVLDIDQNIIGYTGVANVFGGSKTPLTCANKGYMVGIQGNYTNNMNQITGITCANQPI